MGYPYFSNPYQQPYYQPPVPDQLAQLRQNQFQRPQMQPPQQMPTQQSAPNPIIWVQGEEGAKAYMVAAGNSVLLMDSENSAFYIKSTDVSGVPLPLRTFDYTERTATPRTSTTVQNIPASEYVTRIEFNALEEKIDNFLSASTNNSNSKKKKEESNDGEPTV